MGLYDYQVEVARLVVPEEFLPHVASLTASIVHLARLLCPVDTGALQASILGVTFVTAPTEALQLPSGQQIAMITAGLSGAGAGVNELSKPSFAELKLNPNVIKYATSLKAAVDKVLSLRGSSTASTSLDRYVTDVAKKLFETPESFAEFPALFEDIMGYAPKLGPEFNVLLLADDLVLAQQASQAGASSLNEPPAPVAFGVRLFLAMLAYGEPVEYGTEHQPPQPFIRPAVDAHAAQITMLGGTVVI